MESRQMSVGYNDAVVEAEELGRRLKAVRELRGISQVDLGELLAGEGFGKHDIGRVERGGMAMQGALRREVARLLNVPEELFLVDDVDEVLWQRPETQLDRIESRLAVIELALTSLGDEAPAEPRSALSRDLANGAPNPQSTEQTPRPTEQDAPPSSAP